ncbi:hypothetical protein [Tenacibaculum sp. IB213877]|uniref:hypothetical protein n=1 Tax=Tenacibaculum sp. IB213877 TaxID=3097351 RepID=UPI002A5AEDD4|nr:hypothetical protein [Tenacibaculum sp. IB213877]MDY0781461.1 hypothetical protein [Tenacibaculum sp. IB213877]
MKKILLEGTLKLVIGGIIIGVLHKYDSLLAVLLFLKIIHSIYKAKKNNTYSIIFIIGMIFTGLIGLLTEYIGTEYGHWQYHEVNTQLPNWLFFAWVGAFVLMYGIEAKINLNYPNLTNKNKQLLVLFMAFFFPSLGEMIAINLGTWTYYWPYQILNLPLLAFFGLTVIHYLIHATLTLMSKKLNITDIVFNPMLLESIKIKQTTR